MRNTYWAAMAVALADIGLCILAEHLRPHSVTMTMGAVATAVFVVAARGLWKTRPSTAKAKVRA